MQEQTTIAAPPAYTIKGDIPFSNNWNNKLFCKYFTTIRLCNYAFYQMNNYYRIILQKEYVQDARLSAIRYCKIADLPEMTCYLDAGMSKLDLQKMLMQMYSKQNINWETQLLAIMLFENQHYQHFIFSKTA